jgi:hypothetical protein
VTRGAAATREAVSSFDWVAMATRVTATSCPDETATAAEWSSRDPRRRHDEDRESGRDGGRKNGSGRGVKTQP